MLKSEKLVRKALGLPIATEIRYFVCNGRALTGGCGREGPAGKFGSLGSVALF